MPIASASFTPCKTPLNFSKDAHTFDDVDMPVFQVVAILHPSHCPECSAVYLESSDVPQ